MTAKRKAEQLEGYLLDVSPTKRGPRKEYFHANLHTQDGVKRLLCFTPTKQPQYRVKNLVLIYILIYLSS